MQTLKTLVFISLALMAFAGNSVLCRLALGGGLMDAAGFTVFRLLSGALTLMIICLFLSHQTADGITSFFKPTGRQIKGALMLFSYALCFSYAYVLLDTGTGALILFAAVQLTLLLANFLAGKRFVFIEWLGVLLSFSGLIYLLLPAWGTPSLMGFVLMTCSGVAWGLYTLAGKGSEKPLLETTKNFIWCVPLAFLLSLLSFQPNVWTSHGLILAVISGALTSGVGYAIWYAVLPKLSLSQAGVLQLLVPVLAALGGVVFAAELLTIRLMLSAALVLGGIYLVLVSTKSASPSE
ncbi:DMT family transporter [Marinicella litoralis]|uniref:Threonine/homoserine efflux transporter RhtA n=1 Tax=Marinicella litoralis TaxID=644220 RepID=A0A4R6XYT0_9GAMM|nr:DMT family transporter [Marinicella litoralis]TDR23690.1 threonine/homoserine efflux transporter RhtA [Marinicella litoralis]